jgi:hypothetical protein
MADEIIQDPLEAANYLLRQYRDNPNFEFTQEEASLVHNAYQGGVSFVDSKPVMDEASTSSFLRSQDESDPTFVASEEEFSILKATEPGAMSRIGGAMAGAAEYFGPVIKEGIPELIKTASMREPRPGDQPTSLPATLLEAGARGTVDLGTMAVGASKFIEKAPFMAAGALGLQDDYKSYLNQKTIDQNYQMQAIDKMNAERAQGKSIIGLPEGTFAPKAAEAASLVLDPTLAVPFIGPGAKATGVAGRGLGATTKIAGGIETAARATGGAIDLGVEKVGQGIQRVLPGVTAPKTAGAIATGAAAIGIPGAFPIGAKVAGVRAGAEIAERGAQAVRIAGEEAMTGPSRITVMERVAKNQKNPEWLRKAANTSIVSSPITQGAAELGLETGKGAVKSAAVGAGLGYVASGGEEEGIGGGLVIGGGLGGLGGAVKGVAAIPAKKALAKQGDVNRLFARQADLGLDVNKIADYVRKDNRPFLDAATLQMMAPDVQVEFHGRDSFMMPENAGINAAGVVKAVPDKSGTTRLLVNMDDMRSSGDTVKHEIMHAIMKSPAINKAEGRMAVMSEYGEEGLRRFGNEYARKLLEGERQGRGAPTEAEVRAKANELREGSQRSEPGAGDLDWIADEVLAEQFVGEFRGKDLDSLRRKTIPGTNLLSLQEGYLAPVGRLLNKFGIDTTGPKPTNIDTLFKDNPLVPSKQLRELTSRWFRDRDKYLDGLEKAEKQKDVTLVPGPGNRNLANNPAIQFTRNRKTNLEENDFAVRFPDGTVRAKDPASILAVDKARVADVGRLYNPDAVLERGSPEFGVKIQSDGKPYVGGNTLPEGFFNLDSFNDFTKEVAKALQDSRQEGKTYSVWYQKIGTGEDGSWAQSVKRGLGNIKVGQSEIAFLGWRLSKAGNILAQAVDISALRGRMLDFARSGKGRINEVWGGDLASYEKDVMQYLDNHANSRPGETGIGIDKRNAINYLFGITNEANKNANPMYAAEGRPAGSLVKSYRLDRIANSRDTGRTGFFFDYQKQAANLAPATVEQKQFAPASPEEIKDEEFWVSQRNPKAVKATENPLTEKLIIGLDVILKDKELAKKQADLVKKYPGFSPKSKTTEGILGEFVDHVKGNLLYLYDSFKPELREEAKKWYDGARKISEEWAGKYGTSTRQNAGVLAVLSPQKDWFMNVSLADRVIDINTNKSKEVFSPEMFNWLKSDPKRAILAKAAKKNLLGKRYDQISDTFDKAVFLRAWDEVNNSRSFDVYSPNGQTLGKKLNDDGSEGKVAWGSFPQIEKGISILGNGARENIHNQLGEEHKVRNFFNNILQPNSKFGDVTIDTHAVAAGLLRPLSGGSTEVLHNLGGGPSSKIVGASGTYALFAEAYRNAAKERGVLPREMQSITWEAIRGLFKPTFKGQAKNKAFVDDVWKSYTKGKVKIDEARDTISKFAGGIEDPSWARRSGQVPAEGGTATNAGELPERSVARQDGDGRTGRGVRGATARNVQTQDLESAVKSRLIKKQLEAKK